MNYDSFGVSVLGDFTSATPPSVIAPTLSSLIAWKATIHEFDPAGSARINGATYAAVSGHRDANNTTCPGARLYAQLPSIRSQSSTKAGRLPSLSIDRDLDNREGGDVLTLTSGGRLQLTSTTNAATFTTSTELFATWPADASLVRIPGDFDGDGAADLVFRRGGSLMLASGDWTGNGKPGSARRIDGGWTTVDEIVAPGDWNGDGRADLLGRSAATGELILYAGNGRGGFVSAAAFNKGWNGLRLVVGVGDWDGDGAPDLLGVTPGGEGRIYRGNGAGGFRGVLILNGSWREVAHVVATGDMTGDTRVDLLAVRTSGAVELGRLGSTAATVSWTSLAHPWGDALVVSN